jgi:cysteinyl-tRNA synthetase
MKKFVVNLANYARTLKPDFLIITHNTPQLGMINYCEDNTSMCQIDTNFTQIVDAFAVSNLFYGLVQDDQVTPSAATNLTLSYLGLLKKAGETIMVIDYCWSSGNVFNSYFLNNYKNGFISYANYRSLASLPTIPATPFLQNRKNISSPNDANNFLFVVNTENFKSKFDFMVKVSVTNYDMLVISPYLNQTQMYSASDLTRIKRKFNGGKRLLICYLNVGEASDYLPYWQRSWQACSGFIDAENPGP